MIKGPAQNNLAVPVFVCGCERSGTTLLGAMLGAHPEYVCIPAGHFQLEYLRARARGAVGDSDMLAWVKRHPTFRLWPTAATIDLSPDDSKGSIATLVHAIVADYARQTGKSGYTHWIDHTPMFVRHSRSLLELYPEARFIHIVRDGRAVAASVTPLPWGPNTVANAAPWWVERVAHGLVLERTLGPDRVARLHYEDLVSNPEPALRGACERLGLDFHPAMLTGTGISVPPAAASGHDLVGSAPDSSRAEAWRTFLKPRDIAIFESLTDEFLESLGYELTLGLAAKRPRRLESRRIGLTEFVYRDLLNPIRERLRRRQ